MTITFGRTKTHWQNIIHFHRPNEQIELLPRICWLLCCGTRAEARREHFYSEGELLAGRDAFLNTLKVYVKIVITFFYLLLSVGEAPLGRGIAHCAGFFQPRHERLKILFKITKRLFR